MKNETKLEKLKAFLDENGIGYTESYNKGKYGHSDLVLPKYMIFIKLQGEDDDSFYASHHVGVYPVFVRDIDTPRFVLRKVQNTIIRVMQLKQENYLKKIMRKCR